MPCEITVAQPAPATPILNTIINKRSRPIFIIEANMRKYKGDLLSPIALNIPAIKLYAIVTHMPPNTTII